MNCAKISKNLVMAACDAASSPKIDPEVVLINHDDFKNANAEEADGVISEMTLPQNVFGVRYKSAKNAFDRSCTLSKGTYINSFDHKLTCRIFVKTQSVKDEMNKLKESKVVAIVKNMDTSEDAVTYELLGADNGLEMSEFTEDSTASDGIRYQFVLASGDDAKESQLPKTINAGTPEQTSALVAALYKEEEKA